MSRNPNWKKEEVILALGLYWSHDLKWLSRMCDATPEIVTLSKILNDLDLFTEPKGEKFRSVGSIRMKLSNFKSLDTRYGKTSLPNIGRTDREMWFKYLGHFDDLARECVSIISTHYKGHWTHDVETFLAQFTKITSFSFHGNMTAVSEIREQATAIGDEELVQKCDELLVLLQSRIDANVPTRPEHGGINQSRLTSSQTKIGEYVKTSMEELIAAGRVTNEMLECFTSEEWSRRVLHLGHSFFKEIRPDTNIRVQLRDKNGYLRYWKKVYSLYDHQYVICKEWFESGRKHFDKWVSTIDHNKRINCNALAFKRVLEKIKKYDQLELYISTTKLKEDFHGEPVDIPMIIDYLMDQGVLVEFQGSIREFNVDDYELLFRMIGNPENYVVKEE